MSFNHNKINKYNINPMQISKRQLHLIWFNHVLFNLNKLSKDTAFMFTFTPFSYVKLTASKNFLLNFTSKWNKYKAIIIIVLSTDKQVKGTLSTSVRDHMLDCDHTVAWENFSVIDRESNHYLLETKESFFIKRDNPSLNRNKYSQELFLF